MRFKNVNKEPPRQEKATGVHCHQPSITWNDKGLKKKKRKIKEDKRKRQRRKYEQQNGNKYVSINNWI